MRDREEHRQRENAELSSRIGEADKIRAGMELELKSAKSRNEQLVKSQSSANQNAASAAAIISNRQMDQQAIQEQVKGK